LLPKPGSKLSKSFADANDIGDHSVTDGITHDDFQVIYTQWHNKIGVSSIGCLASSEYMHTRAALIVLSRIVLVYPTQPKIGDKILKSLASLQSDDNPRPDIRATAQGYYSQLTKARDEGMWKEENIAVTRARQEKEKAKAEERKKNLALQHENMKKESEAITREIGDGGRYGRDRRDDRGRPDDRSRPDDRGRPWGGDSRVHQHQRGPPLNVSAPIFTPKVGAQRELGFADRRELERRGGGHERDVYVPPNRRDGPATRRQDENRGERRKRSRSPEQADDSEHQAPKRSRGEWAPPRRSTRRN
jgi:THO complex subunit 2